MLERFSKFILFEASVGCFQNGLKKAVTCLMKVSTLESERKSKGLIYCQQITKFALCMRLALQVGARYRQCTPTILWHNVALLLVVAQLI